MFLFVREEIFSLEFVFDNMYASFVTDAWGYVCGR